MCNKIYNFREYRNVRKYYDLSLKSTYYKLLSIFHELNEFSNLSPQTEKPKTKKKNVYENFVKLYNSLLSVYFKEWNNTIDVKKIRMANTILVIYLLKVLNIINGTKSVKKKVGNFFWKSKSR